MFAAIYFTVDPVFKDQKIEKNKKQKPFLHCVLAYEVARKIISWLGIYYTMNRLKGLEH